ncbi:hypothetical protein ABBQ38_012160 [Trebouxia sp. C0009 RCD-2024]
MLGCACSHHHHCRGCFAAGTGFLLTLTVCEHPPGSKLNRSTSTAASHAPLAPDQHRLTDDGELVKPTVAPPQHDRRQDPKGSKVQMGVEEGASQGAQWEGQGGSQLEGVQDSGQKGQLVPGAMTQIKGLAGSWEFRKYMAVCIITVNLKAILRHLDATLPKYQVRSFGCSAPVGTMYSINPAMIMTLGPLVGAAATHYSHFDVIHYGSYVSALGPLWMALFTTEWATVLFVIQLSLGESIWSPRWYDYSMSVAPEGREGVFPAMASASLFLGKFVTGTASGYLLGKFCPNDGVNCGEASPGFQTPGYQCHGHILWLNTVLTCMSPLGTLLFQGDHAWLGQVTEQHDGKLKELATQVNEQVTTNQ